MSQDKITVYFSSRGSNAIVGASNASINYVTNFSSFLDPNCGKYQVETTFLSELYTGDAAHMGTLISLGLMEVQNKQTSLKYILIHFITGLIIILIFNQQHKLIQGLL